MGILKALLLARIMFSGWRTLCAVSSVGVKCTPYIGAACAVGLGAYTIAPHVRPFLAANFPQPRYAALPASPTPTW
jgi:hypothetical protein